MLCWEGYDSASIVDPFVSRNPVCFEAETLLSDVGIAQRLPNRKMQSVGSRAVSDPREDGTSVQSSYN